MHNLYIKGVIQQGIRDLLYPAFSFTLHEQISFQQSR